MSKEVKENLIPEKNKEVKEKKRDIIKEKKPNSSRGVRLRTYLVLTMLLMALVLLAVYVLFLNNLYKERTGENLRNSARNQSNRIAERISDIGDLSADLDFTLSSLAGYYDGRVLLVDKDYKIVRDTKNERDGSYIISEALMTLMTGTEKTAKVEVDDAFLCLTRIENESGVLGILVLKVSTEDVNRLTGSFRQINIIMICVLLLIALAYIVFMSNGALRGLRKLTRAMETARDGHLGDKLMVKGFREYRQLSENYNKTIEQLNALDSTRQEFVSNVSHELKTPITSMKVLADSLISNEEADLSMYKEFMKDIALEIDRESEIITDLLTLVKTDKQSAGINTEEKDINALLEMIIKRVTPIAEERDIDISYESYREVTADIDEVKLSLALTNIIENAVKYNVDGGSVKVSLNADHKNFHIKVADTGVGIPDDCKDKVFERFYRVDKARSRDTGGTGLGLAITKNVISMHHGTIKLYSESGQGTTFTIRIPLHYTEHPEDV